MSYGRNIEPQLLSIEAIIQKSQFKSKILNNIPVDLKRLFLEEANKNNAKMVQPKRVSALHDGLYSQTMQPNDRNHRTKKSMPPLPSRQIKSQSLNSSMSKNTRNTQIRTVQAQRSVYTTRTNVQSRENSRKRLNRKSLGEDAVNFQKIDNCNMFDIENQNVNAGDAGADQKQKEKQGGNDEKEKEKDYKRKFHRFQYELVLPEKDKKDRGFRKVNQNMQKLQDKNIHHPTLNQENQNKLRILTQEIDTQQNYLKSNEKHSSHNHLLGPQQQNPLSRKKQHIPDFVLAALNQQQKKHSLSPSKAPQPPQFYQLQIDPPDNRQRILKQPTCIVNMKKKISYNRFRRSQQSYECQQILQPKVNFVKLIQRNEEKGGSRKTLESGKEKKITQSKDRLPLYRKQKGRQKVHVEEDVKGWDIVDGPHYYDQY